jgi:hypothetical protein
MRFHAQYSSNSVMLSAVMYDLGQIIVWTRFLLHTGGFSASGAVRSQPQCLLLSRPVFLQLSQFHPAWLENWKWNATISFFFRLR